MDAKEKLIMFIQLKNEIIEKETGIQYASIDDIMDVNDWEEKECENIYKTLIKHINKRLSERLCMGTCIWCLKNSGKEDICKGCGYGERHGKCDTIGSSYCRYNTDEIEDVFTNDKYKSMLKQIKECR